MNENNLIRFRRPQNLYISMFEAILIRHLLNERE